MGIAQQMLPSQPHPLHRPQGDLLPLGPAHSGDAPQRLGDDLPHQHPGIEGGHGVLKDHLKPPAGCIPPPPGARREFHRRIAGRGEPDRSLGGRQQPGGGAGEGGFPAAAFPHQPQAFPPLERQIHAVHGPEQGGFPAQQAGPHRKMAAQAANFQDRRAHGSTRKKQAARCSPEFSPSEVVSRSSTGSSGGTL